MAIRFYLQRIIILFHHAQQILWFLGLATILAVFETEASYHNGGPIIFDGPNHGSPFVCPVDAAGYARFEKMLIESKKAREQYSSHMCHTDTEWCRQYRISNERNDMWIKSMEQKLTDCRQKQKYQDDTSKKSEKFFLELKKKQQNEIMAKKLKLQEQHMTGGYGQTATNNNNNDNNNNKNYNSIEYFKQSFSSLIGGIYNLMKETFPNPEAFYNFPIMQSINSAHPIDIDVNISIQQPHSAPPHPKSLVIKDHTGVNNNNNNNNNGGNSGTTSTKAQDLSEIESLKSALGEKAQFIHDGSGAIIGIQVNQDPNQAVWRPNQQDQAVWSPNQQANGHSQGAYKADDTNQCCATVDRYFVNKSMTDSFGHTYVIAQRENTGASQIIRHGVCGSAGLCHRRGECVQQYVTMALAVVTKAGSKNKVGFKFFEIPGYCACKVYGKPVD